MRPAATLALVLAICGGAAQARDCAPDVALLLTPDGREQRVTVEIADEPAERALGLMNRSSLPPNHGMLFVYQRPQPASFWMKNTLIPLAVAFIADDGTVVNLDEMAPQTLESHCSTRPVRHVLEMNAGWFARKGIKPGSKLSGAPFGTPR